MTPPWLDEPPPPEVPGTAQLTLLLDDAARRATTLLRGEPEPVSDDPLADAVRMLAGTGGHEFVAEAAAETGLPEEELRRLVLAHRHGGSSGVLAALGPVPVDPGEAIRDIRAGRGFADLTTGPRDGHRPHREGTGQVRPGRAVVPVHVVAGPLVARAGRRRLAGCGLSGGPAGAPSAVGQVVGQILVVRHRHRG